MRPLVSDLSSRNVTPAARALRWALPWSRRGYPGFHHGVVAILDRHITYASIQHWCAGRRRMSVADATIIREHIAARIAAGRDILAELDGYIAMRQHETRRLSGCCAIGEGRWDHTTRPRLPPKPI
jgi:hypothetical protein